MIKRNFNIYKSFNSKGASSLAFLRNEAEYFNSEDMLNINTLTKINICHIIKKLKNHGFKGTGKHMLWQYLKSKDKLSLIDNISSYAIRKITWIEIFDLIESNNNHNEKYI